jgi:hypothetical protein
MRRLILICMLALAGCQNVAGPFAARPPQRVDDPSYSIAEQERRGRDRMSIGDDTSGMPPSGMQPPGSLLRPGY